MAPPGEAGFQHTHHIVHRVTDIERALLDTDLSFGDPGGIEQIIEVKLNAEEKAALDKSAASVRELVKVLGL